MSDHSDTESPPPIEYKPDTRKLHRFIGLALQGKHRGSSSGEKAARAVAMTMLDHGISMDDGAIEGLIDFIRLAKISPTTARDAIKGW